MTQVDLRIKGPNLTFHQRSTLLGTQQCVGVAKRALDYRNYTKFTQNGCEKEQLKSIQSDNEHEKSARESAPILGQRTPGALQAPDLPPSGEVEKPLVVLVGKGWEVEREI
ncbi:hypothetical protein KQX54_011351 [Cotesia glomerata]|uniref:Uncharacterized protein n=1 Tax=Cotesia glomerata TaxID=32391 RepID=A0AAV7I8L0_COTGL|nr:hypothetical protein KQX54_011351 [Cotesia glomerata]